MQLYQVANTQTNDGTLVKDHWTKEYIKRLNYEAVGASQSYV